MSIAAHLLPSYTYSDFKGWEGDWELIEGIPYSMAPSPSIKHQSIGTKIITLLENSTEGCTECLVLYEQDWKISETTTIKPDVVLVCNETGDQYITRRPEVVIEILSKSSVQRDEIIKPELCANEQVPYYIVVYPNDLKARVFKLAEGKYVKVDDFTHEVLEFEGLPCAASIDFKTVFQSFR